MGNPTLLGKRLFLVLLALLLIKLSGASESIFIVGPSSDNDYKEQFAAQIASEDALTKRANDAINFRVITKEREKWASMRTRHSDSRISIEDPADAANPDTAIIAYANIHEMNVDDVAFLYDAVRQTNNGFTFIQLGEAQNLHTEALLRSTSNCSAHATMRTAIPNSIYFCNGIQPPRTIANIEIEQVRDLTANENENVLAVQISSIFASASEQHSRKPHGHEGGSIHTHVKHRKKRPSKEKIEQLKLKAKLEKHAKLLEKKKHHHPEAIIELPLHKRKLPCKYRKSCYSTGIVPIPSATAILHEKLQKMEAKEEEDEEGAPHEINQNEIKLVCKYRKSCYEELGHESEKKESAKKHRVLAGRKTLIQGAPKKKRTLKDIAHAALRQVDEQEKRAAKRTIPKKVIIENKLNAIEEAMKRKIACRYRKSCYETGVRPTITDEEGNIVSRMFYYVTKRKPTVKNATEEAASEEEPTATDEELEAKAKKLFCKYRKSCYESGKKPVIEHTERFKIEHVVKKEERVIPKEIRCKYRKSCYETGTLPTIRKVEPPQNKTDDKKEAVIETLVQLKLHCKYRKSCYQRQAIEATHREQQEAQPKEERKKEERATRKATSREVKQAKRLDEDQPIKKETTPSVKTKSIKPKVAKQEVKKENVTNIEAVRQISRLAKKIAKRLKKLAGIYYGPSSSEEENEEKLEEVKQKEKSVEKKSIERKDDVSSSRRKKEAIKAALRKEQKKERERSEREQKETKEEEEADEEEVQSEEKEQEEQESERTEEEEESEGKEQEEEESEGTEEEEESEGKEQEEEESEGTEEEEEESEGKEEEEEEAEEEEIEQVHEIPTEKEEEKIEKEEEKEKEKEGEEEEEEEVKEEEISEEEIAEESKEKQKKLRKKDKKREDKEMKESFESAEEATAKPKAKKEKEKKKREKEAERELSDLVQEKVVGKRKQEAKPTEPTKKAKKTSIRPKVQKVSSEEREKEEEEQEEGEEQSSEKKEQIRLSHAELRKFRYILPVDEEEEDDFQPIIVNIDGEADTYEEKLICKYRKSCYKTGMLPRVGDFKIHHLIKKEDHVQSKELRCKFRKSCYQTGRLPDLRPPPPKVEEAAAPVKKHQGVRKEIRCKYRKSCYATGVVPEIEGNTYLFAHLQNLMKQFSEEDMEIRTEMSEDERRLSCKYRKSCYETGKLPEIEKETIKTIADTIKVPELSIQLRCKYRKSCYAAFKLDEQIEKDKRKARKPEVAIQEKSNATAQKVVLKTKAHEEKRKEKEKETDEEKEEKEEKEEESDEGKYKQIKLTESERPQIRVTSAAEKLKCKYRRKCYEGVPLEMTPHVHTQKKEELLMKGLRRPNGQPCNIYYISCRKMAGLPIKERAPIGPDGRRLCRKKPKKVPE